MRIEFSPDVAGHLYEALRAHRLRVGKVPEELRAAELFCAGYIASPDMAGHDIDSSSPTPDDRLMTASQTAIHLGISERTVRRWSQPGGRLKSIDVAGKPRWRLSDLLNLET